MIRPTILPRSHLLMIKRDRERGTKRTQYVCLDRNEQVTPLPKRLRQEILRGLPADAFNAYPEPSPLYERLSRTLEIAEDELLVTAGSDSAIRRVFETFVDPGDTVVFADPTFPMYEVYSQMYQAKPVVIPFETSRDLPIDRVFDALLEQPRILALVNPAQPTGTTITAPLMRRLAAAAEAAGTVFLVDEAYFPFFPDTAVSWFAGFSNVIVTRTFSKAGGIAGLRLGYLVTNRRFTGFLEKTRGSHEVNAVAIAVGSYLLDHPEIEGARLHEIETGRAVLNTAAQKLGLETPDCEGNFQLLSFPGAEDTTPWIEALRGRGFLVKGPFSAPCVRNCIRVTLDGPETMRSFTRALASVVRDLPLDPATNDAVLPDHFEPAMSWSRESPRTSNA